MIMKANALEVAKLARSLRAARSLAGRSSELYLQKAKSTSNPQTARALEASAIERAVIADQFEQIASQQYRADDDSDTQDKSIQRAVNRVSTPLEATVGLHQECKRLYRITDDKHLRAFLRDLMATL